MLGTGDMPYLFVVEFSRRILFLCICFFSVCKYRTFEHSSRPYLDKGVTRRSQDGKPFPRQAWPFGWQAAPWVAIDLLQWSMNKAQKCSKMLKGSFSQGHTTWQPRDAKRMTCDELETVPTYPNSGHGPKQPTWSFWGNMRLYATSHFHLFSTYKYY